MSQNTLIEKINADAAATAAEITAASEAEVKGLAADTDAKIAALEEQQKNALEKQLARMELVAISRAKQQGKIKVQQAKRDQINEIFAAVVKDLVEQPSDTYISYFTKQLTVALPDSVDIIAVRAAATRLEETRKILEQVGVSGDIIADSTISAGLVIEAHDGVYDVTLARLMKEMRPELEMVVTEKLSN